MTIETIAVFVFALGLPVWLAVEEIAHRLKTESTSTQVASRSWARSDAPTAARNRAA